MKPLEDELRSLLRREEPPPGFASRLMARIEADKSTSRRGGLPGRRWPGGAWPNSAWMVLRHPALGWALAATLGLVLIAGAMFYQRERRARLEGERARDEAILALRIACAKLNGAMKQASRVKHHETSLQKAKTGAERL